MVAHGVSTVGEVEAEQGEIIIGWDTHRRKLEDGPWSASFFSQHLSLVKSNLLSNRILKVVYKLPCVVCSDVWHMTQSQIHPYLSSL